MKISLVLLAAGGSRRFGGNKLLEEIEGKPMYRHIADEIRENAEQIFADKIVVTQYEEIAQVMETKGYRIVRNHNIERGLSWSVRLGLDAAVERAGEEGTAVCFAVCDQPYLKGSTVGKFLEEWEKSGKGLGCLGNQGRLGNPAVFSSTYFERLRELEGDRGGRSLIAKYQDDVYVFEADDERELEDIDIRRSL